MCEKVTVVLESCVSLDARLLVSGGYGQYSEEEDRFPRAPPADARPGVVTRWLPAALGTLVPSLWPHRPRSSWPFTFSSEPCAPLSGILPRALPSVSVTFLLPLPVSAFLALKFVEMFLLWRSLLLSTGLLRSLPSAHKSELPLKGYCVCACLHAKYPLLFTE